MAQRAASAVNVAPDWVRGLQALGFSEYEARTYIALLRICPATAYEISKAAGVPRANTYSALENLTKKMAVQPVSERPVRYMPLDPESLFGRISKETRERCRKLAQDLGKSASIDTRFSVWSISGEQNVHAKIAEMIDGARDHVWIKASADVLEQHRGALKRAADRGTVVVVVLFGDDARPFQFGRKGKAYLHEGNGVRMGFADNLFTVTTDFREALTASVQGDVYGAYTQSKPVVTMAETLIRHDVYLAEIFACLGDRIDSHFGPYLSTLRRVLFSPEQRTDFERNLQTLKNGRGNKRGRSTLDVSEK